MTVSLMGSSQLQNNESEKKSSLSEKYYFTMVPKITAFCSINADY
jgi:hypothetical protein